MKPNPASSVDLLLTRARTYLEPEATDETRNLQGLQQQLLRGVLPADSLRSHTGRERPGASLSLAAARRVALQKVIAVAAVASALGFVLGFSMGQRSSTHGPQATNELQAAPPVEPGATRELPSASSSPPAAEPTEPAAPASGNDVEPGGAPRGAPPKAALRSDAARRSAANHLGHASADATSLRQALELLHRARAAQAAAHPNEALLLLSELDRRVDGEMLAEERLLTRILVWCDLGNGSEARRLATELRRRNPNSLYSLSLRSSCADDAPSFGATPPSDAAKKPTPLSTPRGDRH